MKSKSYKILAGLLLLASTAYAWTPSASFLSYVEGVEGYRGTPYKLAGVWHIGYGHAIKPGEVFVHLDRAGARALLRRDIQTNAKRFEGLGLDNRRMEMMVDFSFNGCGPSKFPKFYAAILANDGQAQRKECVRYAKGVGELRGRNRAFIERYF